MVKDNSQKGDIWTFESDGWIFEIKDNLLSLSSYTKQTYGNPITMPDDYLGRSVKRIKANTFHRNHPKCISLPRDIEIIESSPSNTKLIISFICDKPVLNSLTKSQVKVVNSYIKNNFKGFKQCLDNKVALEHLIKYNLIPTNTVFEALHDCKDKDFINEVFSQLKIWEYVLNNDESTISITKCNCSDVSSVLIPHKIDNMLVTKICNGTFDNYKSLATISIPKTIKTIDGSVFSNCSIKEVIWY